MKKQILVIAAMVIAAITAHANVEGIAIDSTEISDVNARVIKNFHKEFPTVTNESWYKSDNGNYTASFTTESVHMLAGFSSKGRMLSRIKFYNENLLSQNIWEQVKSVYYAYDISGVAEINTNNRKIYLIYLSGKNYFKTISITDDEMQEIKSFSRM